MVEVDAAGGLIATSDSFFCLGNVERDHPTGIAENVNEAPAPRDRVRRTADSIVPLYDPDSF